MSASGLFLGGFLFDLTFAYNIGWKHILHIENGLESYFNE